MSVAAVGVSPRPFAVRQVQAGAWSNTPLHDKKSIKVRLVVEVSCAAHVVRVRAMVARLGGGAVGILLRQHGCRGRGDSGQRGGV